MAKASKNGKDGIDRWSGNGVSIRNITPPKKKEVKKGVKKNGR